MTRSSLALLALLALESCGGARVSVTPPSPIVAPTQPPSLQDDLAGIFGAPQFERSFWSVLVRPVGSGQPLYALNSGKLVMPGSNMKILTLASAAVLLGWDYRFETKVIATAPLSSGVLGGDLIVVGGGDPSISERSDEPGALRALARQVADAGLRIVDGRVIGDDDLFDDKVLGDGWSLDNLPYGYSAPVGALEYNEGSVDLVIRAGASAGEPVAIQVRPEGSRLDIENRLVTVSETGNGALTLQRLPGSSHVVVEGQIPARTPPFARTASVDNPTDFFVRAFRSALIAEGVQVSGDAIDIDDLPQKPDETGARVLATRQSPALRQLAAPMMRVSQNQYAEMLLKKIGKTAARDALRGLGVADDHYIMADGSGLSRYNYVTADALVTILQQMHQRPADAAAFPETLPVAGRDGTLARRLAGTAAAGKVRAKSGTIDNARALSGYIETAGGEKLVFSIIANNFSSSPADIDAAADKALIRLAAFRR
ncbi:MAG: D-alanyl-D-alanine carboxypeptidase/D-alanyl-D-alanine-endopeptidase [Vicinamibacterales bacterium]|nr:D-alanyl-D-alanine carboxypeptidase/D-alanyl-D-alanine-endopeptidase [Vicinamibacterales bacterium]